MFVVHGCTRLLRNQPIDGLGSSPSAAVSDKALKKRCAIQLLIMRQREMLKRAKRSFRSLNSVNAGFVPSIKRPSYVAITRDLVREPSTVSVAPEHFVSSTVVKVSKCPALKIGLVRFTNARGGQNRWCGRRGRRALCGEPARFVQNAQGCDPTRDARQSARAGNRRQCLPVQPLLDVVVDYLPSPADLRSVTAHLDGGESPIAVTSSEPAAALIFKVVHD